MFRIKICGVTSVDDAQAAVNAGADAVGLNFYEHSPRCVDRRTARQIASAMSSGMACVGVFVNETAETILPLADEVGLDWIQLHGDEPPELVGLLKDRKVIRALRLNVADGLTEETGKVARYLRECRVHGQLPDAVMLDARVAGSFGGTGRSLDWQALAPPRDWLCDLPLVLAGGLTPDNVSEAVDAMQPQAVDVASGVESSPGRKDPLLVERFVRAARAALTQIDSV